MENEENYSGNFSGLDHNSFEVQTHHDQQEKVKSHNLSTSADQHHNNNHNQIFDNVRHSLPPPIDQNQNFYSTNSFDKLSFADVMQFAEFGPKSALDQNKTIGENNIDLKFQVDHQNLQDGDDSNHLSLFTYQPRDNINNKDEDEMNRLVEEDNMSMHLRFLEEKYPITEANKGKRKRPRSVKTSKEVESQRMTHIAVERNRRKQMNEHLRVLRSLMPNSYVQRGDQASIIGGAIEFAKELEQLLQCLESQKRRRVYGDGGVRDPSSIVVYAQSQPTEPPLIYPSPMPCNANDDIVDYKTGFGEETAESKSCLADVEVKVLGFDALIKILSRRRPAGQLIKTIAALEQMELNIIHTNITTIEQTVLYSFNVKIGGEARFTAEDMANAVQQMFSFIHTSST